ncbi:MAG: hypothetical protein II617_04890 [Firmicutes bacterium]|nr:hypothetical protein [Bacillota bacterium]
MLVKDVIKKEDLDLTKAELVELIQHGNRQVDLVFADKKTDEDGYLSWNQENWVSVDGKRFICSYFRDGKALSEFSGYNISDINNYFEPDKAVEVRLG